MRKLPNFKEALEITKHNECFTHRIRMVDGYKVSIFDYLMANYSDFEKPIPGSDITAFELRGLAFTHELKEGFFHQLMGSIRAFFNGGRKEKVVGRFLMLHKFFNLNQCKNYQYDDVKHLKVIKVMDKMDGSVMRFIRLPNGKIVCKSKTFFDNDQTKMATAVYEKDENLKAFIKETLDAKLAAIFELTSKIKRVVVVYNKTELTLLQLRDEATGEYLDVYNHPLVKKYNIKTAEKENYTTLAELIELSQIIENKEGWVVELEGGILLKIKGSAYLALHGLLTNDLASETSIMGLILTNKIDDVLAELEKDDTRKIAIDALIKATNHYIVTRAKNALELALTFAGGPRKDWVLANKKHPLFYLAVSVIERKQEDREDHIINSITNELILDTNRLEKARKFIQEELKLPLIMDVVFESVSEE